MRIFWSFFLIRVIMAFMSWGYFVPDESWQSVEVAHKQVFGNGHLTWEWKYGLRSYLHPLLFAALFKILQFANMDTPYFIIIGPKLLQALLSGIGDVCMIQVFRKLMLISNENSNYFACSFTIEDYFAFVKNSTEKLWIFTILYTSNWFLLYASSRTLINTMETCLTNIALKFFVTNDSRYVGIIALCFMMRPTVAIFWLPLVIYDVLKSNLSRFLIKMLPQAVATPFLVVLIDTYFYGKLTIVPWNFVNFNIINNISEQYGTEPWHWYLTNFLPALTLVFGIYPLLKGIHKIFHSPDPVAKVILFSVIWSLFVYSILKHKEHRFFDAFNTTFTVIYGNWIYK